MAYTTVNKSSDFFNTVIYNSTGNDNLAITGVGFEADLTWIKKARVVSGSNTNEAHMWADQVRGGNNYINSSSNAANASSTVDLKSWQSDGFTLGTNNRVNQGSTPHTYAAYNWKAGGGQGSSNTAGSINTTYTSVNTTAGFSISKYVGTGSTATVGHGLGAVPKMLIIKDLSASTDWSIYHVAVNPESRMVLNTTSSSEGGGSFFNDTTPTSSVFTIGTSSAVNYSGRNYICYAFTDIPGYSKFGSYTGNGNGDGSFIYTGFKPAWIMRKRYDGGANHWSIMNSKRFGYNEVLPYLVANTEAPEEIDQNVNNIDILSNGFKCRESDANGNGSGNSYIYMAFGQSLVGSNNVPCTAR